MMYDDERDLLTLRNKFEAITGKKNCACEKVNSFFCYPTACTTMVSFDTDERMICI